MRGLAYAIAVIAAVGIMIGIAMSPQHSAEQTPNELAAPAAIAVSATPELMTEAGTLILDVPNMHCEFACFPRVKEAIESTDGVQEVQLAPQQEEGTIDNRQVVVKYDAGFDLRAALTSLSKEGFADADVVQ
jgi:copper chaperone CopZ